MSRKARAAIDSVQKESEPLKGSKVATGERLKLTPVSRTLFRLLATSHHHGGPLRGGRDGLLEIPNGKGSTIAPSAVVRKLVIDAG